MTTEERDAAIVKLAFLKSKGITVGTMKEAGKEPRLMYVVEHGSELCDNATVQKLTDAEVDLAKKSRECITLQARVRELEAENAKLKASLKPNWVTSPLDDNTLSYIASEVSHDMRCESKPGEGEMRVRWNNRAAGMLLKTIEYYRSLNEPVAGKQLLATGAGGGG